MRAPALLCFFFKNEYKFLDPEPVHIMPLMHKPQVQDISLQAVAYSGAGSSLPYSMHGVVPYPMMYATTTTTGGGGGGGMEYMQQVRE